MMMKKSILLLLAIFFLFGLVKSAQREAFGEAVSAKKINYEKRKRTTIFATGTVQIPATATPGTGLCSFDGSVRVTNNNTSVINWSNTVGKGITWKVEVPAVGTY